MTSKTRRRLTFRAARTIVFERLRLAPGWDLDSLRVWPRVLRRAPGGPGAAALYFKPQAIWFAAVSRGTPVRADASPTRFDVRDLANMDAAAMLAELDSWCAAEISRTYEHGHVSDSGSGWAVAR